MKKLILLFAILALGLGLNAQVKEKTQDVQVKGGSITATLSGNLDSVGVVAMIDSLFHLQKIDTLSYVTLIESINGGTIDLVTDITTLGTITNTVSVTETNPLSGGQKNANFLINSEGGSAAWTSASTLTLSGDYPPITKNTQLVHVMYVRAGESGYYKNGQDGITLTISGTVITIAGAAGDTIATGDDLEVGINAPLITTDYVTESVKNQQINPLSAHYVSPVDHEETAQTLTTTWADFGDVIDMRSYRKGAYWVILDINDGVDFQVRFLAVPNQTATDEYNQMIATISSTVITIDVEYIELDTDADIYMILTFETNNLIPGIQPQIKVGTDGGVDATATSLISKAW